MNIFVAGSGAWGTALAMLLVDNHHTITLWTRTAEKAAAIRAAPPTPMTLILTTFS